MMFWRKYVIGLASFLCLLVIFFHYIENTDKKFASHSKSSPSNEFTKLFIEGYHERDIQKKVLIYRSALSIKNRGNLFESHVRALLASALLDIGETESAKVELKAAKDIVLIPLTTGNNAEDSTIFGSQPPDTSVGVVKTAAKLIKLVETRIQGGPGSGVE